MKEFTSLDCTLVDQIATLNMKWPQPHGSMDEETVEELLDVMDYLEDDTDCSMIVFRGLGTKSPATYVDPPSIETCRKWEKFVLRLDNFSGVTLTCIDGVCPRFCAQLVLACDHHVMTETSSFHMPEVKEGYLPGMNTFRITKYAGIGVARRMIFSGAPFSASDAYHFGIVDRVCGEDQFELGIQAAIDSLTPVNPTAVQMARRLLNESFANTFENAIGNYLAAQYRCLNEKETEGVMS